MADVEWFADVWSRGAVDYYVTLARGISPQELAERVARGPVQQLSDMTLREADARVDLSSIFTVGRLAVIGGWSVLVEAGGSDGMLTESDVSRDKAEILIFDPRQDDPPSYATYLKDGELLLSLPFAAEYDRGGAQPDVLLPEMLAAGVVTEGGPTEEEHDTPSTRGGDVPSACSERTSISTCQRTSSRTGTAARSGDI